MKRKEREEEYLKAVNKVMMQNEGNSVRNTHPNQNSKKRERSNQRTERRQIKHMYRRKAKHER